MNRLLSKEEFTKIIESYKKSFDFTDELNKLFDRYDCDGEIYPPIGSEDVVTLLEFIFDDRDEWISYWIFELDFGKEYEDGYIKDRDGKHIPLKTSDNLYDLLVDNYRSRHPNIDVEV